MGFRISEITGRKVLKLKFIYNSLYSEYSSLESGYKTWKEFIAYKDLGLLYIPPHTSGTTDMYEIIDEKKWALSKIKYGI
jgi:hypothetical protein